VNVNQNLNKKRADLTLAPMSQVADLGLVVAQVVAQVVAVEMKVEVAQTTQMTLKRATMKVEVTRVTIPGRRKRKRAKKM
jgi:hypothetical protein